MKTYFVRCWVLLLVVLYSAASFARGGEVDVVAIPGKLCPKAGESVTVFIQVTNRTEKPLSMPSGQTDSQGRVLPDVLNTKIRVFRRIGIVAEETEKTLDGTAVEDARKSRSLNPGESIVYSVKLVPFQSDAIGTDSVAEIDLGSRFPEPVRINFKRKEGSGR